MLVFIVSPKLSWSMSGSYCEVTLWDGRLGPLMRPFAFLRIWRICGMFLPRKRRSTRRQTSPNGTLSSRNVTGTALRMNPDTNGDKPASNRWRRGRAGNCNGTQPYNDVFAFVYVQRLSEQISFITTMRLPILQLSCRLFLAKHHVTQVSQPPTAKIRLPATSGFSQS